MMNYRRNSESSKINISKYLEQSATFAPSSFGQIPIDLNLLRKYSLNFDPEYDFKEKDETLKELSIIVEQSHELKGISDKNRVQNEAVHCQKKEQNQKQVTINREAYAKREDKQNAQKNRKQNSISKSVLEKFRKKSQTSLRKDLKQRKSDRKQPTETIRKSQNLPNEIQDLYQRQNQVVKKNVDEIFKIFSMIRN